jgi:ATP-dependent Lhr-like helicase
MNRINEITAIRRRLKHAWVPFFARFGKLTPVQEKTIPIVLDGANVVVASPTASGKTEAVVAPVAERFVSERWDGLAILYIVPTRALANDILSRIEGPLRDMGITAQLKHGDKPHLTSLPNCLITTPESLDSLVCRRPQVFSSLRAVVLDEIHLLDNTYRGDQMRLLLYRLQNLASNRTFSIYLLSATLSQPHQIAERYVSEFVVVMVAGQREIDYHIVGSHDEVYHLARQKGWKKVLYFCNLRESVEATAAVLGQLWHPYPVVAHHGSLNRRVREEAETVMKEAKIAICVATSTLEIGIDIGDIDLVVLAEPPWSISALLQRIGRGNRREGVIHVAAIATSDEEKALLDAMFQTAASGELPTQPYEPDLSVAVQQTFSYLYQHPEGVEEVELLQLLSPLCSGDDAKLILAHLRQLGWLEWRTGRWFASTRLMDMGEKGRIHSNIPDSQTYKVVDADSGKEIGKIAGVFDDVFVLAQRTWKVVTVSGDIISVRRFKGKASSPMFKRHRNFGAFFGLLPPKLRHRFSSVSS